MNTGLLEDDMRLNLTDPRRVLNGLVARRRPVKIPKQRPAILKDFQIRDMVTSWPRILPLVSNSIAAAWRKASPDFCCHVRCLIIQENIEL
jgi:hypothetical protein